MTLRKRITSSLYNFLYWCGIEVRHVPRGIVMKKETGTIHFSLGKFSLIAPADHALPGILAKYPHYSYALGRLAKAVQSKYPRLRVIDVGANIGDSAAIIRSQVDAQIACIEGYDKFYQYLLQNIRQFPQVVAFSAFIGDTEKNIGTSIEENQGTIRLLPKTGKTKISITTLDKFLEKQPIYKTAQLLKIDTDGYDLFVIRGATNYIKKTQPVIYLEYAKFCFKELGADGPDTIRQLERVGYTTAIFYDSFGRFVLSTTLNNHQLLRQLDAYMTKGRGAFPYFDIAFFHQKDTALAQRFILEEEKYFHHADTQK